MTDREEKSICEHLAIPLRDHFDAKIQAVREYFEARLVAMDTAIVVAKTASDYRMTELNQMRREYTEDRGQYVLLIAYETTEKERTAWREQASARLTTIETRSVTWTSVLGIFFVLMQLGSGVLLYFLLHK